MVPQSTGEGLVTAKTGDIVEVTIGDIPENELLTTTTDSRLKERITERAGLTHETGIVAEEIAAVNAAAVTMSEKVSKSTLGAAVQIPVAGTPTTARRQHFDWAGATAPALFLYIGTIGTWRFLHTP